MKKNVKILSLILAVAMLVSVSSSCGKNNDDESGSESGNVTEDIGVHYVSGMLHERNVRQSDKEFVKADGATDYSIVYDEENGYSVKAANFISDNVASATGAKLKNNAYDGQTYNADARFIVLNINEMFAAAGLTMPTVELGSAGYCIKTVGNSVFIMSTGTEGLQTGSIAFLEELLGYDMAGDDFVVYEKDGKTLPEMEITEKPDYEFRDVTGQLTKSGQYGMGYTDNDIIMPVGGAKWHNSFALLNPQTYYSEHKGWYSDTVTADMTPSAQKAGQLCYTAHGDETEYKAMVQTAYERLKSIAEEFPALSGVSVTEQDNYEWCDCSACTATVKKYGANSATCLKFCNDVAENSPIISSLRAEDS